MKTKSWFRSLENKYIFLVTINSTEPLRDLIVSQGHADLLFTRQDREFPKTRLKFFDSEIYAQIYFNFLQKVKSGYVCRIEYDYNCELTKGAEVCEGCKYFEKTNKQ